MITHVKCDIFEVETDILCHQVNAQGVMGAGLAYQMRIKHPEVYGAYRHWCKNVGADDAFGSWLVVPTRSGKLVVNICAQKYYGYRDCYTDYATLYNAFKFINKKYPGKTVAVPHGIGCGLAGGNWDRVYAIIEETLVDVDCLICHL